MSWMNRWRDLVNAGVSENEAATLVKAEREAAEREDAHKRQREASPECEREHAA